VNFATIGSVCCVFIGESFVLLEGNVCRIGCNRIGERYHCIFGVIATICRGVMTRYRIYELCCLLTIGVLLGGCSTTGYKEKADFEAYGLLQEKNDLVPGAISEFSIEPREAPDFTDYPTNLESYDFLGDAADSEIGSYVLTLEDALKLAVKHSRSYQSRKEQLFVQALSLSIARHDFDPIFSGNIAAQYDLDTVDGVDVHCVFGL